MSRRHPASFFDGMGVPIGQEIRHDCLVFLAQHGWREGHRKAHDLVNGIADRFEVDDPGGAQDFGLKALNEDLTTYLMLAAHMLACVVSAEVGANQEDAPGPQEGALAVRGRADLESAALRVAEAQRGRHAR